MFYGSLMTLRIKYDSESLAFTCVCVCGCLGANQGNAACDMGSTRSVAPAHGWSLGDDEADLIVGKLDKRVASTRFKI